MTGSPFVMNPFHQVSAVADSRTKTCPFGANCSCVFARVGTASNALIETQTGLHSDRALAEVANWTRRGWIVTSATPRRIVLERQMKLAFCTNAALCVVTGMLWLAYWIPRARHPKIDTRIVTVSADGEISTTRVTDSRSA